ncbi:MAG: ABC transporter permease subunit [Eubacterium sp.]
MIHSLIAGYVLGRSIRKRIGSIMEFIFILSVVCSYHSLFDDAACKTDSKNGTGKYGLASVLPVYGILSADEHHVIQGYLNNLPLELEEAAHVDGSTTWTTYWKVIFPNDETNACNGCNPYSSRYME